MKRMNSEEIIRTYIDYFKKNGHTEVESASLIPHNDPSILWINAGVTPLKKYFDGTEVPSNRRLVSCQKCIRTGDIEEVGKTARHHTFFQMLGNFSIGDYFKKEALTMAFELLTSPEYFGFDIDKLYVTVYPDDIEANNLWASLGIDPSHIIKLEGNYWEIGEGPSGPDSEIFYDRGEKYDPKKLGIKLLQEEIENDRYIEIWNNVFSQYNAKAGVPRNEYEELPSKNIDTGMGVERMACIMQETETNYETDLFMPIMNAISELSQIEYTGQMEFKVIADHARTLVFAISDGATFENYGRGYVLRRLLRRAVRMGKKLGISHSFMADLVDVVINKYVTAEAENTFIREFCEERGCEFALSEVWEKGGEGGIALAEKVLDTLENKESHFHTLYEDELSLKEKIEKIATEIYGAKGVVYEPAASKQLAKIEDMGFGDLPICMAKNQYSLSDDAKKLGRPENFDIHIREVYVSAGAGFVVALTGAIMTMPGLPKVPAANGIDVSEDGMITGLF